MSYAKIDPIIKAWATKRDLVVLQEEGKFGRRVAHTSSRAGETFQIVIEPERNEVVRIDAHLIETWNEEEVHYIWQTPVQSLRDALDVCVDSIQVWFNRTGHSGDATSIS